MTYITDKTFGEKLLDITYTDRVGAYLIVIRDGRLATTKAPKGHYLPGGGIMAGESHIDCIIREAREETGYEVRVDEYLCCADKYWKNGDKGYFHPVQYYYAGDLLEKTGESQENDTHFEWLPLSMLEKSMVVDAQIWAVRKYLKSE
ncbi:MAG: NUDIX domain-containing protein [Ruminococcaceae bacterium]|nr:NUDIX domain-containing protein [Oscillospiraceae bacterium]